MQKPIRVLHLASFTGNIGDNANHLGARSLFETHLKRVFHYDEIEIRDFYRKQRFFDENFIELVNSYDLFVIGGGNYFELWPPNSRSGTSIDLGPAELAKIRTPTLFYSLGVDPGQGVPAENKTKFEAFLETATSLPQFFISVRNDGALKNLTRLFGSEKFPLVVEIPDGGFFAENSFKRPPSSPRQALIGINVAGDMLETRLKHGKDTFLNELTECLSEILSTQETHRLIFFNHVPKDLSIASEILNLLPDKFARGRVLFAPYEQGNEGATKIFQLYGECDLILANRFHANVVSIALGIPTIGLCNYVQIENLYAGLNWETRTVDISRSGFKQPLQDKIALIMGNLEKYRRETAETKHHLDEFAHAAFANISQWLTRNNL